MCIRDRSYTCQHNLKVRSGYITGEYFFHFSLIRIVIELFQMIFQGCTHLIHEKGCLELNGARDIAPRTLQDNLHQNWVLYLLHWRERKLQLHDKYPYTISISKKLSLVKYLVASVSFFHLMNCIPNWWTTFYCCCVCIQIKTSILFPKHITSKKTL